MSRRKLVALVSAAAFGLTAGPVLGLGDVPHDGGVATVLTGQTADAKTKKKVKRPAWAPEGFKPCKYEDSDGPCYWDASTAGNKVGQSFVVWPVNKDQVIVVYVGGKNGKAQKFDRSYS